MEVFSPLYPCIEPDISDPTFSKELVAENNFEEAYIELSLEDQESFTSDKDISVSIEILRSEKTDGYSSWRSLKKEYFSKES